MKVHSEEKLSSENEHLVEELEISLASAPPSSLAWKRKNVPSDLLKKSSVNELILMAMTDWLWITIFLILMWNLPSAWVPLFSVLIAGRIHGLGVVLHDATHLPIRGKNARVRFLELLSGFPVGSTLNAMRYHHIRHHRDTGMNTDPYFISGLRGRPWMYALVWLRHLLLAPFWIFRSFYGSVANIVPRMRNSYGKLFLMDPTESPGESREVKECAREEKYQALFFSAVFLLTWKWPEELILSYWIPLTMAGLFAGYRLLAEHKYIRREDRSMSSIVMTTNDHSLGPLAKLFLAPHNVGYHLIHHIHPQVGIMYLPALRRWYMEQYPEYPEPLGGPLGKI